MTLDELKKLTPVELEYISAHIYKLVKDMVTVDTTNEENFNKEPECCHHCKNQVFIKYGYNMGKQKYYCKCCGNFFLILLISYIINLINNIYYGNILLLVKSMDYHLLKQVSK